MVGSKQAYRWVVTLSLAVCGLWLPPASLAQPPIASNLELASDEDRKALRQIDDMLAARQEDEAVERMRRLLEDRGDRLLDVGHARREDASGHRRYLPLSELCQLRLAQWATTAPAALELYRRRVDPLAERWYTDAVKNGDEAALRRVAERMFASSFGDDALYRLGEYHLGRGEYVAARDCWERISPLLRAPPTFPDRSFAGRPLWLALRGGKVADRYEAVAAQLNEAANHETWRAYPDTDIDLADVRARLALVSIMEGSLERAAVEIELIAHLHPEAQGTIAGRTEAYTELLGELLADSRAWPRPAAIDDFPTFAGRQSRDGIAARGVDVGGLPTWQAPLTRYEAPYDSAAGDRSVASEVLDAALPYFPVVVDGVVVLAEPAKLRGYRLHDGQPLIAREAGGGDHSVLRRFDVSMPGDEAGRRRLAGIPLTVTATGGRLLGQMGVPLDRVMLRRPLESERNFIVGLDQRTLKLLFDPVYPGDADLEFDGAPVSDGQRFYALLQKTAPESKTFELQVGGFDLATGKSRWQTGICRNQWLLSERTDEVGQPARHMLSLHDDALYINTNLGYIAAVAARDGAMKWVYEYTRIPRDARTANSSRDVVAPNPCLIHKGLVIAAPADSARVLALDAATGQLVWETEHQAAGDVVHLLGAAHDHLIAGGDYLYWIDLRTGQVAGQFPQGAVVAPGLVRPYPRGYGRGLLAGDDVYWPTHDSLFVFRQQLQSTDSGRQPVALREIDLAARGAGGGNLAISDGVLIIATAGHLYAFDELGK